MFLSHFFKNGTKTAAENTAFFHLFSPFIRLFSTLIRPFAQGIDHKVIAMFFI